MQLNFFHILLDEAADISEPMARHPQNLRELHVVDQRLFLAIERGQVRLPTSGWDANMTAAAPPMPISRPAPTVDSVPLALGSVSCTQEHGPPIAQPTVQRGHVRAPLAGRPIAYD
jgi:hypothetical protein